MTEKLGYELQLSAMRAVIEALEPLDPAGRESVLNWVTNQLGVTRQSDQKSSNGSKSSTEATQDNGGRRQGTVNVVANKLGAQSCRDLLLAAAVHLTAYQGKDSFTRDELVSCAREARNWKANYSAQIAINIKRMATAGVLFEKSKDVFSLSDNALNDAEQRLA